MLWCSRSRHAELVLALLPLLCRSDAHFPSQALPPATAKTPNLVALQRCLCPATREQLGGVGRLWCRALYICTTSPFQWRSTFIPYLPNPSHRKTATFSYQLAVRTLDDRGAGTTGSVTVALLGDHGSTGDRPLPRAGPDTFSRGRVRCQGRDRRRMGGRLATWLLLFCQ